MKTGLCIVTIFAFALGCARRADNELWLIPEGYCGYLVVIPNRTNGIPKRHEKGFLLYEFPRDGVLKTQFELNYGVMEKPEYFMVGANGARTRVSQAETSADREKLADGEWYVSRSYVTSDSRLPYGNFLWIYVDQKHHAPIAKPRPVEELLLEYAKRGGDI